MKQVNPPPKITSLDALNVATTRLFKRNIYKWSNELEDVHFTGFKPCHDRDACAAQLYGKSYGEWFYVPIYIGHIEVASYMYDSPMASYTIIKSLLDDAVERLNQAAGVDSFDRWVQEVRREAGKSTT